VQFNCLLYVAGGSDDFAGWAERTHPGRVPAFVRAAPQTTQRSARVVQTVRGGKAAGDAAGVDVAPLLRLRLAHGHPQRHPLRAQSQLICLPGKLPTIIYKNVSGGCTARGKGVSNDTNGLDFLQFIPCAIRRILTCSLACSN